MPLLDRTPTRRVLILGGGFGGIYAALELEKILAREGSGAFEVTLVTRDNFFLFTPMLHEVAASDLELSTIVNPLRKLLRRVNTFVGTIEAIDVQGVGRLCPARLDRQVPGAEVAAARIEARADARAETRDPEVAI